MLFKDDVLYINMEGEFDSLKMNFFKYRVFTVLEKYEIENIILDTKNATLRGGDVGLFINEYKEKYNGNVRIHSR